MLSSYTVFDYDGLARFASDHHPKARRRLTNIIPMDTPLDLCHPETSALLVVDIQPTLTAAMSEEEGEQMLNHTGALLQAADALEVPVFLTEQYPKGLGTPIAERKHEFPDLRE